MHLSNIRLLVKKFAIVLLFLSAFVMMLVNKTDTVIIEKTSSVATDVVSPLIDVLVIPARALAGVYDYFRELKQIHEDNNRLREENRQLVMMSNHARALEIENKLLSLPWRLSKEQVKWLHNKAHDKRPEIRELAQEQLNARFHPEQFVSNDLGDFEDFLLDEDESEW